MPKERQTDTYSAILGLLLRPVLWDRASTRLGIAFSLPSRATTLGFLTSFLLDGSLRLLPNRGAVLSAQTEAERFATPSSSVELRELPKMLTLISRSPGNFLGGRLAEKLVIEGRGLTLSSFSIGIGSLNTADLLGEIIRGEREPAAIKFS
jgi:hypothetical protein